MGIYFGSNFNREPFQYDSVGNHWQQESVTRAQGYQPVSYTHLRAHETGGISCTIIFRRRRAAAWCR